MKKTTLIIAIAFLSASLFNTTVSKAQNEQGKSVVTIGAGQSLASLLFRAVTSLGGQATTYKVTFHSTPAILGMYDYALASKFSLGLAVSYQTFSASFTDYTYHNTQGDTMIASFTDRLTRMNFGIRPLFHFGDDPNFDPYFGARISYTQWAYTSNNPDTYYDASGTWTSAASPVRFQVLLGMRYFFGDLVGINGEVAIGPSYYLAGGINFKF